MPITTSAKKALRQSKVKKSYNDRRKRLYRNAVKEFKKAVSAKEFDKAKDAFAKLVEIHPMNLPYRATLAALYAQFGEFDRAIAEAETTARLAATINDQSYIDEAKLFIEQIKKEKEKVR